MADENLGQLGVGEALGDAHEVVVVLVFGVASDVDGGFFLGTHVGDEFLDVVDALVGEADDTAGEVGVAASEVVGGFFQHEDAGTLLAGGLWQRRGRHCPRRPPPRRNQFARGALAKGSPPDDGEMQLVIMDSGGGDGNSGEGLGGAGEDSR